LRKEVNMNKKFRVLITIAIAVLLASAFSVAFTGNAFAVQQIMYDGYLQMTVQAPLVKSVLADTLIVVSNPGPAAAMCNITVYDKKGVLIKGDISLYDTGGQISSIPANGFGWITLGMLVDRTTIDPWGSLGNGEKFVYRIKFGSTKPAIVEIKQVIYIGPQEYPSEAIWNATNIRTWTETSLGGLRANGLIQLPNAVWP
jgi:hypothetical protein